MYKQTIVEEIIRCHASKSLVMAQIVTSVTVLGSAAFTVNVTAVIATNYGHKRDRFSNKHRLIVTNIASKYDILR